MGEFQFFDLREQYVDEVMSVSSLIDTVLIPQSLITSASRAAWLTISDSSHWSHVTICYQSADRGGQALVSPLVVLLICS